MPLEITKRESGHVTNLVLHVLTMFFKFFLKFLFLKSKQINNNTRGYLMYGTVPQLVKAPV